MMLNRILLHDKINFPEDINEIDNEICDISNFRKKNIVLIFFILFGANDI